MGCDHRFPRGRTILAVEDSGYGRVERLTLSAAAQSHVNSYSRLWTYRRDKIQSDNLRLEPRTNSCVASFIPSVDLRAVKK
jgi:hypothetical protein